MSKKYKELAFVHSKELKIPNEIWERFQDLSKPHITFQDTLDSALCVSAKLGNEENFNYIQSLIDAEKSLKDNETFKSLAKISENIKKSFEPPQSVKDYLKNQQEASKKLYEMHKPMIDAMNEVRDKTLKSLPNPTSIVPTLEKVRNILDYGLDDAVKRTKFHEEKAKELEIAIKEIDDEVVLLERTQDMKFHKNKMVELMQVVELAEPTFITQFSRETYKEMKKMETPTSSKHNKKYPKAHTEKVVKGLKAYWADNLPFNDNPKFLHDRKTWFNKLADENGISFKQVEKIEKDNRPIGHLLPKNKK